MLLAEAECSAIEAVRESHAGIWFRTGLGARRRDLNHDGCGSRYQKHFSVL
jgi:hypothetical protein